MSELVNSCLILVILTMLTTLGASRIVFCIRTLAVQGMVLSLLPLAAHSSHEPRTWILVLATFTIKGIVLPWLLQRARREADVPREVEPYVGFGASILFGVMLVAVSFWVTSRLPLPEAGSSTLALPTSLCGIFCGLFLIVSRRKAIMQVLGYLTMENGAFVFGMLLVKHQPLVVEMGILLDLFVGVFVMGIAIFHISRELEHMDVDRLVLLNDSGSGEEIRS